MKPTILAPILLFCGVSVFLYSDPGINIAQVISSALEDKKAESELGSKANNACSQLGGIDGQVAMQSVVNLIPEVPSLSDVGNQAKNFAMAAARKVINADYKAMGNAIRAGCGRVPRGCNRIKKSRFVEWPLNKVRQLYWQSDVIVPQDQEFGMVFPFGRSDDADTIICVTSDGYKFVIPQDVIVEKAFLSPIVCRSFDSLIKKAQSVTAAAFYVLCFARKLQLNACDNAAAELQNLVNKLDKQALFDVLRAYRSLSMTNKDLENMIYNSIAEVLVFRVSCSRVKELIEQELSDDLRGMKKLLKAFLKAVERTFQPYNDSLSQDAEMSSNPSMACVVAQLEQEKKPLRRSSRNRSR